jgi:membrane protease YdiL (CAAX protease family)
VAAPELPSVRQESPEPPEPRGSRGSREGSRRALIEALVASVAVTLAVTLVSWIVPNRSATAVGFLFLGATWLLVWRRDDACVEHAGLAFGGLVLPGKIDRHRLVADASRALAWALAFAAVVFVPFFFGWRMWWRPEGAFAFTMRPLDIANELFGQLVIIALPEEAFYRGYLQTRLDDVWPPRLRIAGARVGLGLVVGSAIFALGHLATIRVPARLAVFFPALVFGWLRARTGGVGASVVFHALCNVFSEALWRGYGMDH